MWLYTNILLLPPLLEGRSIVTDSSEKQTLDLDPQFDCLISDLSARWADELFQGRYLNVSYKERHNVGLYDCNTLTCAGVMTLSWYRQPNGATVNGTICKGANELSPDFKSRNIIQ